MRLMLRKSRQSNRLGKLMPAVEMLETRCLLDAGFLQTNLVSDVPGLATSTDPNLKNPWGLTASPKGPFWVSDNGPGMSTLYNGAGQAFPIFNPLVVTIPAGAKSMPPGSPTGIVFNGTNNFMVSGGGNSGPSLFLFATEDGTIAGWSPAVSFTNAVTAVDNSGTGADYNGLAINDAGNLIYAANNGQGRIDVFDASFHPVNLAGAFSDPNLPAGYVPYGIQNLNGKLYVTYIPSNFSPGGVVDVFNFDGTAGLGNGKVRLITGGALNMPWGMAVAPNDFGHFNNDLLVGNVADGLIHAYNPHTGVLAGTLSDANGNPIANPGLWGLRFGNGGLAGDPDTLFFNAGINGYADGLFGSIQVNHHAVGFRHDNQSVIPNLPASPTLFVSSNSSTGDQNPYGIAYVPAGFAKGGPLNPGDLLVANFNNSANLQGTGSTIVRITPNGQTSTFFQGPSGIGLTTALGVLRSGFIIVGNVPTVDGTSNTISAGSLIIIDRNGNEVMNLTDSALLDGPWDLTVNDEGDHAQVFVSNVLSGTVTRIDLTLPDGGVPIVESLTQIASGYVHRSDPAALVIGPTGLAFDAKRDLLYVASTGDNQIFAIPRAAERNSDAGTGKLVVQDNVHLHGPLGLLLAPNGDLITANGDAVNADPKQPSEIVEFTTSGKFVGQVSLHPNPDAAFGIALQFNEPGDELNFAAVDDNTNTVHVWTIDTHNSAEHRGRDRDHDDIVHAGGHLFDQAGVRLIGSTRSESDLNLAKRELAFAAGLGSSKTHHRAVDFAFTEGLFGLWDM